MYRTVCDTIRLIRVSLVLIFGLVDDYYATLEWSEGGMIHAHMAFWIVGAPRIDNIAVPRKQRDGAIVEINVALPGAEVVAEAEAADRLATFWDRAYTEFNVAKTVADQFITRQGAASRDIGMRQCLGPAEGARPLTAPWSGVTR